MNIALNPNETVEHTFGIPLVELPNYRRKPEIKATEATEVSEGINYPLLDEIMSFIENHPQQWDQAAWFKIVDKETGAMRYESRIETVEEVNSCGAAFCFAGHVALAEGFPIPPKNNREQWTRLVKVPEEGYETREEVSEFAAKRLGLSEGQAEALFAGENTIEDLKDMVEALHLNPKIRGWVLEELRDDRDRDDQTVLEFLEEQGYVIVAPEVANA